MNWRGGAGVNKDDWTLWPEGAPRLGANYDTRTSDESEELAAMQFEARHGRPPGFVFVANDGLLRLGPVPERQIEWVENSQ